MRAHAPESDPRRNLSWTLAWKRDRVEDRRGLYYALAGALLLHASLLSVRLTERAPLPTIRPDAVIFPTTKVVIRKPVAPPTPVADALLSSPSPVKIPVPAPFVPPEPMHTTAPQDFLVELPPAVGALTQIDEPPPVSAGSVRRFTGDMTRPVRLDGVEPTYTEAARRSRTQGMVVLDAVIDTDGRVIEIEVLRPLGFGLTESAVRAVRGWRFEPAILNGRPVTVRYNLTVHFSLH